MSHSTLRSYTKNFRVRSLSAPESVSSQIAAMKQERSLDRSSDRRELKARKKLILEAGLTFHPIDDNRDIKACAEVGQELRNISELIVKRYEDESRLTIWMNNLIAELMAPYQRYSIHHWIQEQGGLNGLLKLTRNKYQAFVDCFPRSRRMGSWRQIAVAVGVVTIGVIAAGAGIYFR